MYRNGMLVANYSNWLLIVFFISYLKHKLKTTRKATAFKSLGINCWETNQIKSKWQMESLDKTWKNMSKTEKSKPPLLLLLLLLSLLLSLLLLLLLLFFLLSLLLLLLLLLLLFNVIKVIQSVKKYTAVNCRPVS